MIEPKVLTPEELIDLKKGLNTDIKTAKNLEDGASYLISTDSWQGTLGVIACLFDTIDALQERIKDVEHLFCERYVEFAKYECPVGMHTQQCDGCKNEACYMCEDAANYALGEAIVEELD